MSKTTAATAAIPKLLTQNQLNFLYTQIAEVERKVRHNSPAPKKPAAVVAAENLCDVWNTARRKEADQWSVVVFEEASAVRETMLFQSADVALVAFKAFQKKYARSAT